MSERALQRRVWKIRRVDKLLSFIKVQGFSALCGLGLSKQYQSNAVGLSLPF